MEALGRRALEILGEFHAQNVANTACAFAKMEMRPEALVAAKVRAKAQTPSLLLPRKYSLRKLPSLRR